MDILRWFSSVVEKGTVFDDMVVSSIGILPRWTIQQPIVFAYLLMLKIVKVIDLV